MIFWDVSNKVPFSPFKVTFQEPKKGTSGWNSNYPVGLPSPKEDPRKEKVPKRNPPPPPPGGGPFWVFLGFLGKPTRKLQVYMWNISICRICFIYIDIYTLRYVCTWVATIRYANRKINAYPKRTNAAPTTILRTSHFTGSMPICPSYVIFCFTRKLWGASLPSPAWNFNS